jgi:hypothetical protein
MWNCRCSKWPKGCTSWVLTLPFFFGNSAFLGIYIISRLCCMSLGPCNLQVMNVLNLKKWVPRRCFCFNTHTHKHTHPHPHTRTCTHARARIYAVILVCLMLCTWPVSGSHGVNKVHTACRIAVTSFFLHYFSAYKAENCALMDYYTTASSGSFLPTFWDNLSFLPLSSGGGLLCRTNTPVRFLLSRSVSL